MRRRSLCVSPRNRRRGLLCRILPIVPPCFVPTRRQGRPQHAAAGMRLLRVRGQVTLLLNAARPTTRVDVVRSRSGDRYMSQRQSRLSACAQVCPVFEPRPFRAGLSKRRHISLDRIKLVGSQPRKASAVCRHLVERLHDLDGVQRIVIAVGVAEVPHQPVLLRQRPWRPR